MSDRTRTPSAGEGPDALPGIRPNYTLHELHVAAGRMNSPQEPSVDLFVTEVGTGLQLSGLDQLTPDQAREYARRLLAAADEAEGKR